jgi:hypothetical protein
MDHARAIRYRRLALQEPDQDKASLLRLIADEADRGVLVTSDWRTTKRPSPVMQERPAMHQSGQMKPDWNGMDDLAPGGSPGWRI